MAMGAVKWFNPTKNTGVIRPDSGRKGVRPGYTSLAEGAGSATRGANRRKTVS